MPCARHGSLGWSGGQRLGGRCGRLLLGAGLSAAVAGGELLAEERDAYAYFGKATPFGVPQAVPRYANLTAAEFERLATAGRPFVWVDGGRDQPYVGWTCDRFRREYPNALVQLQYASGDSATRPIREAWDRDLHELPAFDAGGPRYAPWYWGVKGVDDPEEARHIYKGGASPLPHVQSTMRLPSALRDTEENRGEVFGSPEFWFSAPGAGATMHMDMHCESTLAVQLSGRRKWRLGWAPPVPNGTVFREGTYGDGQVYGKGYSPPLEAVVSEGEALFMPSAFLHETANVGDSCAVSLTFQIRDPVPSGYFRQSLRQLRRSGDFHECWELLGEVAGLGARRGRAAPRFEALDRDADGSLGAAEVRGRLGRAGLAFHDADGDGRVTAAELEAGWAAWTAAAGEATAKGNRRTRPKSFGYLAPGRPEL